MRPIVYIDVLFAVNLVINYLLLCITAYITKIKPNRLRIFLGALLGAIYACLMFFPQMKAIYAVPAKLAMSLVIVISSFKTENLKSFLRTVFIFYLSSFILGGVTLAILYFTGVGRGSMLNNGIFYFNLPWKLLFFSCGLAYFIIKLAFKVYNFNRLSQYKSVIVNLGDKSAVLSALVDTGNMLEDPLSHTPVVVAEFDYIKNILPETINNVFNQNYQDDLEKITLALNTAELKNRFRLIPFTSLGTSNGLLLGFRPDSITVENKQLNNVTIGIYNKNLSKNQSYNALLNPEIIL